MMRTIINTLWRGTSGQHPKVGYHHIKYLIKDLIAACLDLTSKRWMTEQRIDYIVNHYIFKLSQKSL